MMICGIDTHKNTLYACIIAQNSQAVEYLEVPNSHNGHQKLHHWLADLGISDVGIEGCSGYGKRVSEYLLEAGYTVMDVPAQFTHAERKSMRGSGKTDRVDSLAIARIALRENLPVYTVDETTRIVGSLHGRRAQLVKTRTAILNQVHAELDYLLPGYDHKYGNPKNKQARVRIKRQLTLLNRSSKQESIKVKISIVRETFKLLALIETQIADLTDQMQLMIKETQAHLCEIPGCGPDTAAQLICFAKDIRRFSNRNQFANAAGVAPIPASSGKTNRHRLNPGGNRQANHAIWRIAFTQARCHPPAKAYIEKKLAEGKTRKDAIRCLKRHISNRIYTTLKNHPLTT